MSCYETFSELQHSAESDSTHGPLIHGRAVEKVESHVKDAISRGAQVLVGGKAEPNSNFYFPTVLSDVPADALLTDEETFGPVAALIKFETEEEVIKVLFLLYSSLQSAEKAVACK